MNSRNPEPQTQADSMLDLTVISMHSLLDRDTEVLSHMMYASISFTSQIPHKIVNLIS